MHPVRSQNNPPDARDPTRRGTTPSSSSDPLPAVYTSHTSLPSIRQLHPYLPPSGLPQQQSISGESTSYTYPPPPHPTSHAGQSDQVLGARRSSEVYASFESEADDQEQHSPPKKKRRRQALSCTECKRRKIKCDRSQPCAPCSRRGEQSRCQWHIVEPIEKYVTRAEYDELKARFDDLTAQVQRLLPSTAAPPYYQMGIQSGIPGVSPEAVSTYATPGPLLYQPMMPPPQTYPHHLDASSQGPQRYIKPEDTQNSSRHHQTAGPSQVSDVNGSEKFAALTCLHYNAISSGLAVKKLPRADAHAGRASAPRISGSRRPSGSFFRDEPSSTSSPRVTGTSSEIYIDNTASSTMQPSSLQMQPSSRRFIDSPHRSMLSGQDEDRESLTQFGRDR